VRYSKIVESIPSMVPFVAPEELEERLGRPFLLRLGANESPFGSSSFAVKGAKAALESLQNYADPRALELRGALSKKLGVAIESIVLGSGIDELLSLFCRLFLNPGDTVVTTLGSYPTFDFAVLGTGATLQRIPYRNDKPDLDAMATAARSAKMVYLANPDNPSGWYHSTEDVSQFLKKLPDGCVFLLDEAYIEFLTDASPMEFDATLPNVIRLRTFSKMFGIAGLRLGYAIAAPEHVAQLDKIRLHFGINSVAQAAGLMALQHFGHTILVREKNARCREVLYEMGRRRGLTPLPSFTNFVTFNCGTNERAEAQMNQLVDAGVFIRKPSQPPLDRCIRITIGTSEQLELLDQLWSVQ
jgi:histidinol-phosphate aminotransferase